MFNFIIFFCFSFLFKKKKFPLQLNLCFMSIDDFHSIGSIPTDRKDLTYQVGYFTRSGFKVKASFSNLQDANIRCAWLHLFRPLKRHFYTVRFF